MNIWWTAAVKPTEAMSRVEMNPDTVSGASMRASYVRFPRRQRQKRVCMLFLPVARFGGKSHLGASMGNVQNPSVDELPDRGRSRPTVSAISRQGYSFPILAVFLLYATLILIDRRNFIAEAQRRREATLLACGKRRFVKARPDWCFGRLAVRDAFRAQEAFPGRAGSDGIARAFSAARLTPGIPAKERPEGPSRFRNPEVWDVLSCA